MKVLLLLVAAVTAMANVEEQEEFEVWKKKFGKTYLPHEESVSYQNFQKNFQLVREHNLLSDSFRLGLTKFADQDLEARKRTTGCFIDVDLSQPSGGATFLPLPSWIQVPASIDWRQHGLVTPVKDQGPVCESCWAFSATGALEGQHFRQTHNLVPLSEQQLVDCSRPFGNQGCQRGRPDYAFNYVIASIGIQSGYTYPYNAQDNPCTFISILAIATCSNVINVHPNEVDLMNAVGSSGPVSVAVDASHPSWALYRAGIYNEPACSSVVVTHAVLIVGYGTYLGQDYWLVKNSEGPHWGMGGYIMMSRNRNNQCGIANVARLPLA